MATERARRDVTNFVADFHDYSCMKKVLSRENVQMPIDWNCLPHAFKVVEDNGRILTLAFWDWEKDCQVGDILFEVDFDDVSCWA